MTPLLAFAGLTMPVKAGSPLTAKIGCPLSTAFLIASVTTSFLARVTYTAWVRGSSGWSARRISNVSSKSPESSIWTWVRGNPWTPEFAVVVVPVVVDGVPASSLPLLKAPETPSTIITTSTAPLPSPTASWVWRLESAVRAVAAPAPAALSGGGPRRRRSGIGRRDCAGPGRGGARAAFLARKPRELCVGGDQADLLGDLRRQLEVRRVVLQVPHGVGSPDRIGLAEQVVGQGDVAVGIDAGQLGERGTRAGPHLRFVHSEDRGEVVVALSALE